MTEHSFAVSPRSTGNIALIAERFLEICAPEHLVSGTPLDLAALAEYGLQKYGIWVYPVDDRDLPAAEAETRAAEDGSLQILMRAEFYDALFTRNSRTVRARSTFAHEIGHAVLHADEVRTGRSQPMVLAMKRVKRESIPPYRDAEWQAHTFAGAVLIPRPVLRTLNIDDTYGIADRFEVSEAFARSHVDRVRKVL